MSSWASNEAQAKVSARTGG